MATSERRRSSHETRAEAGASLARAGVLRRVVPPTLTRVAAFPIGRWIASVLVSLATIGVLSGPFAGPATAATSMSPSEVLADIDVTLTLRVSTDPLDVAQSLVASFPVEVGALACGAPNGWSCDVGSGQASWTRDASLSNDDTFTLAIRSPAEGGSFTFSFTDTRTSGSQSTSTTPLTVLPPDPEPSETETASEEPTEEPSEVDEPEPEQTLAPFRPPDGESPDPISISDLPSDEPTAGPANPIEDRIVGSGGLTFERALLLLSIFLLTLSATGFVVARMNR